MHRGQSFAAILLLATGLAPVAGTVAEETPVEDPATPAADPAEPAADPAPADGPLPSITLVGPDYPDYRERLGRLKLLGVPDPDALERTDSQFKRMSLVDVESVEFLPPDLQVYQTVTTDLILPVNVNYVVNSRKEGACFNPEIPYCADLELLNTWLAEADLSIDDRESAGAVARFVVGLALSTVHHPEDFLFFRLSQQFGIQYYHFLRDIEEIYDPKQVPYRSEERRAEYEKITSKYRDVVKPVTLEKVEGGFRMHAFTYKILRAAGDLREWDILVRPDGTVEAQIRTLETGGGELYWSWAP